MGYSAWVESLPLRQIFNTSASVPQEDYKCLSMLTLDVNQSFYAVVNATVCQSIQQQGLCYAVKHEVHLRPLWHEGQRRR
jgi:hypothetical protein